ncbi:MAG: hypothetical protein Q4D03_04515 [Bacteroidales bacterium]|nr:hypothetical protein [Bacteroidales bacterium]
MNKVAIRNSILHPQLYIARGNAFKPEEFGADGLLALVCRGFNVISPSYDLFLRSHHQFPCSTYEYYDGVNPLPPMVEFESIIHPLLDDLVEKGARIIVVPPMRSKDAMSREQNDMATASALASWLGLHADKVEKIILADTARELNCYDFTSM